VNIRTMGIRSSINMIRCQVYRFLTVTELSARQCTGSHWPLLAYIKNTISAADDVDDRWMKTCARYGSIYAMRVPTSTSVRL